PPAASQEPIAAPVFASKSRLLDWKAAPEAEEQAPAPAEEAGPAVATEDWPFPGQRVATQGEKRRLLKNAEEIERHLARLNYLCEKIAQTRRPYCPLNGILLLVPWAATESEAVAHPVGHLCQRDLEVIRTVLRVHCPVFALVCDLEREMGFRELTG